jgi:iron complex outermembrane receptor protein
MRIQLPFILNTGAFLAIVMGVMTTAAVAQDVSQTQSADLLAADQAKTTQDILNLNLDQLAKVQVVAPSLEIPVTTVSKEPSTVGRSPAAVFVISNEMIRRSGVTCVPEALRMAPGVDVARINANMWAITIRGFNARYSKKLLVLIDGRTVYTPAFGGVYWDTQNVLLEDVDRIEVIRGPGATLWGSNAVNGVINIITKKAGDSQGAYAMAGGGTADRQTDAVRYGGRIGENAQYRVYGQYFERGPFFDPTNPAPDDAGRQGQGGFRTDWNIGGSKDDTVTVQGDTYTGQSGNPQMQTLTTPPYMNILNCKETLGGQNVLARWNHICDEDSGWMLQTYYDYYKRDNALYNNRVGNVDVQFQYNFMVNDRNKILCGAEYNQYHYEVASADPFTLNFTEPEGTESRNAQFIQDEITLSPDKLALTLGVRLEEDQFTGLEYQPTARLLYTPDQKHSIWGAASRAVHTPQLNDEYLSQTQPLSPYGPLMQLQGNNGMRSEECWSYEIGYRTQATDNFSYDIATFYDVYDGLRSTIVGGPIGPPPPVILSAPFMNLGTADTYGVELATNWAATEHWRLMANYTLLRVLVHDDPSKLGEGDSPKHQVYLRSSWDLGENVDYDLTLRYVDCISGPVVDPVAVPAYVTMDMRLAWRPRKHLELAVVGQNLLQSHHYEFGGVIEDPATLVTEVPRGVYGNATWRY